MQDMIEIKTIEFEICSLGIEEAEIFITQQSTNLRFSIFLAKENIRFKFLWISQQQNGHVKPINN